MKVSTEGRLKRAIHVALAAGLAVAVVPTAHAQQASSQTDQQAATKLQTVTVTGSAIPRTDTETPAPVQIITSLDIQRSGLTTVADVVRVISADNSGSVTPAVGALFATGAAGVALRGLDVNSTLVLIDGRRAANYALADDGQRAFVDLNSIPINEIDRIEVLKDGASSLYGADAIAGVVNIILRHDYHGGELSGEVGTSQHGGGTMRRIMGTFGGGNLATDNYNAYAGIEYEKDGAILATQRGFPYNTTNLSSIGGPNNNYGDPPSFLGSIYGTATPGTLGTSGDLTSGVPNAGAVSQPLRSCGPGSPQTTDSQNNVYCSQDFGKYGDDQPADERLGLFSKFTVKLSDYSEAYLIASYYQNKIFYELAPSQINSPVPINTNSIALPPTVTVNGQTITNPNDPFASSNEYAIVNYAFGDISSGTQVFNHNYRLVGGVKGTFSNWDYDSAVVINHTSLELDMYGFINGPQLLTDIANGAYNFVDPASNSAAVRSALAPTLSKTSTSDLDSIDFRVTRSLMDLPGGPLGLALGTEYRYEAVDDPDLNPGDNTQGLGQSFAFGQRNVTALYGELDAPVLKSLEADVAARYDHYSDFGGSGFIPKVGLKWKPIDEAAFRATYSKGFRAPSFSENGSSQVAAFEYPYTPPAGSAFDAAHGGATTPDAYASVPYSLATNNIGNPNIRPEKSDSVTLGTVLQPIKQFSVALDYYWIRKRDAIVPGDDGPALAAYYAGTTIPSGFTVTPDKPDPAFPTAQPRPAIVDSGFVNANSIETEGIDLNLLGKFDLIAGSRLISNLDITDIISYKVTQPDGSSAQYVGTDSPLDLNSSPGTTRYRATWANTVTFSQGEVTLTGYYESGIYLSGLDIVPSGACLAEFPSSCRESSFTYFDLTGLYHLTHSIDLTADIDNLFDRKPPFDGLSFVGLNYDPTFAQPGIIGRFFRAGVRYHFD